MKRIESALRGIVADLKALECAFAVLGGFAVSARTEPRTTKDVDVAVRVDGDADAEQLTFELSQRGYRVESVIEQTHTKRLATVRLFSQHGAIVDLLFAASGIEREVVDAATEVEMLEGVVVPVATVGHLIAMKVLARNDRTRPQDRVDLGALFAVATPEDLESARSALALIAKRRYGRGRDLSDELERARVELSG